MALRVAAKVGHQDTRATNRRLVLQSLIRSHGTSRADLARITGLTPATVSALVATLIDEDLVTELGRGPVKVGKPATLLGLNSKARYIVGIDLSIDSCLRGAVVDMAGEISHRVDVEFDGATGNEALALTVDLVADVIAATPGPVLGIGVGTPGVVTPTGTVVEADNLGWFDLDLADLLNSKFGYPVSVANDANVAALAEYSHAETNHESFMVVRVAQGVGAGIVVNGRQHYGESFAAGEIGHMVVADDGPRCRCGNRGCLEVYVAVPRLQAAIASGQDAHDVVAEAGNQLGRALAAVVNVLDIHDIVVAASGVPLQDVLCEAALATLRTRTLRNLGTNVAVRPSTLGDDIILLGASALVMSHELGVA